jgi:putative membrane protein
MLILWLKALHVIFMVTWFSALFYLPRLYVYHAMSTDATSNERFKIMERKLYYGIALPGALLTIFFGIWLLIEKYPIYNHMLWLPLKLVLVGLLIFFHLYCGYIRKLFLKDRNPHGHIFYRWLNEFPIIVLFGAVILAIVKPF